MVTQLVDPKDQGENIYFNRYLRQQFTDLPETWIDQVFDDVTGHVGGVHVTGSCEFWTNETGVKVVAARQGQSKEPEPETLQVDQLAFKFRGNLTGVYLFILCV